MSELKEIILRELSGVLPAYLAKDIAQRISKSLDREGINTQRSDVK